MDDDLDGALHALMTRADRARDLSDADVHVRASAMARAIVAQDRTRVRRKRVLAASLVPVLVLGTAGASYAAVTTDALEDTTEAVALRALVAELDPELAEVVTLAHWEALSFVEIADLQKVAPATVRGRYRRAKLALAASLSDLSVPRE